MNRQITIKRVRRGFGVLVTRLLLAWVTLHLCAQQQPSYRQADIDNGAEIYQARCTRCHGDGNSVPGVDLRSGQFKHGNTDQELMTVIRKGIDGTAMPAHPDLSGNDILSVVAYLRNMRDYGAEKTALGDPKQGRILFEGEGKCMQCHRVNGAGSRVALDLSDTGALHPAVYLRRALLDPEAIAKDQPSNRYMRAVMKSGNEITGMRLNEDTFTVQLMTEQENLVSLDKSQLKSLTVVNGPAMPSYAGKLTEVQIQDLVAYLASLQRPGRVIAR